MSMLTYSFDPPTLEQWKNQLFKELGAQQDRLLYQNHYESIAIDLTNFQSRYPHFPSKQTGSWYNLVKPYFATEKQANARILEALMQGATGVFIDPFFDASNPNELWKDVEKNYIQCYDSSQHWIDCFGWQQIGASAHDELALAAIQAHAQLHDPSCQTLHIKMGVGPELFLEIAKFRALRYLLMRLQEIHGRAVELHVVAEIGFSNKSLKDPYTNLLRQSTEALSAIAGGADALIVNPYDELSSEGSDAFSRRMALNVSNLLQEEAHLDAVADPLNGSYVIEALSSALIDKAWECLQDFCDSHAFNNEQLTAYFKPRVEATRALRLADFESKNKTLIGINAYPNTFETKTKQWAPLPTEAGLPYLIYEMCAHS